MFREMRRKKQVMSEELTKEVLINGTSGVLALEGDDGYPYAVPVSYVYDGEKLYFHGAKKGHKIDAVKRNEKASFCVIETDHIVPEEYTTYFRSVIAFGRMRILSGDGEKRAALEKLGKKYAPEDTAENLAKYIDKEWVPVCVLEMTVDHLSGKEAIEFVREREK